MYDYFDQMIMSLKELKSFDFCSKDFKYSMSRFECQ